MFLVLGCLLGVLLLNSCTVYQGAVLGNKDHNMTCAELPTAAEVTKVVEDHQDVVQRIKDVNPGQVFFDIDKETCPSRADIVISFASHRDRLAIEKIIDGDTFFGVPYRLRNR